MKEFIRQIRLWRIRRTITAAIRRIQRAEKMRGARFTYLQKVEDYLRAARAMHNP
jgi:hypothetical protein